jgi:hypothetical protein
MKGAGMRAIRFCIATLAAAAALHAAEIDSTVILPIGEWNMGSENGHDVDLSPLGVAYNDIYDIQVTIRSDFQDGEDEFSNSATTTRLDQFPSDYGLTGKGGTFYVQPVNGKLTLRLFRNTGKIGALPVGEGGEYEKGHHNAKTYMVNGVTKSMNRGFVVITYNGLKSGGLSTNNISQKYAMSSVAFPIDDMDLAAMPLNANSLYDLWGKDVKPGRLTGLNLVVYSNPPVSVRTLNQKPHLEGASLLSLHADGLLSLEKHHNYAVFDDPKFSGVNPRGYLYLNHFFTSCDENGLPGSESFSKATWMSNASGECSAGYYSYYVMQTRGVDLWGNADNGQFMYHATSGTNKTVQSKILYIEKASTFGKMGVCLRGSTQANGRYAGVFCTPTSGPMFHWRTTDGGATSRTKATTIPLPVWVRVVKTGSTFWGEYSTDGSTWTTIKMDSNAGAKQTATISMGATYYEGLAGSSNSPTGVQTTSAAYRWSAF